MTESYRNKNFDRICQNLTESDTTFNNLTESDRKCKIVNESARIQ